MTEKEKIVVDDVEHIIEDLTQKGGSVPISLNSEDFILRKN